MTKRLDHAKVSLKKRIARKAADIAKGRFRTDTKIYEQETSFLSCMFETAIFAFSPVGFFDVGFVQVELCAHYGFSRSAAKKVAIAVANRLRVEKWEE